VARLRTDFLVEVVDQDLVHLMVGVGLAFEMLESVLEVEVAKYQKKVQVIRLKQVLDFEGKAKILDYA
jgi:hypothetical protein